MRLPQVIYELEIGVALVRFAVLELGGHEGLAGRVEVDREGQHDRGGRIRSRDGVHGDEPRGISRLRPGMGLQ